MTEEEAEEIMGFAPKDLFDKNWGDTASALEEGGWIPAKAGYDEWPMGKGKSEQLWHGDVAVYTRGSYLAVVYLALLAPELEYHARSILVMSEQEFFCWS